MMPTPAATAPPSPTPLPTETPPVTLITLTQPKPVKELPTTDHPQSVTATAAPTWHAWHVVTMTVRDDAARRDGSSAVYHYLLDEHGAVTASVDIKMRMSNGTEDLRVNEPKSQKTIVEDGAPAYFFHIGQGGAVWDCQFYR